MPPGIVSDAIPNDRDAYRKARLYREKVAAERQAIGDAAQAEAERIARETRAREEAERQAKRAAAKAGGGR